MKDNKILFVTGASSDIGYSLIDKVANNYNKILAHYRNSYERIVEIQYKYGEKIIPIQADFSDITSTQKLIETIKEMGLYPDHIVHLSARKAQNLQFYKETWNNFQQELDISLRSIIMIIQQLIPFMSKRKYGKIIFMLTAYLLGVPPKFQSSYVTVKYALLGLMKSLAVEYASKGIMVNAISPEMIDTKFLSNLPNLVKEQSATNNPLGRNLYVEEVVPTFEYLLSDGCDTVTGQNIGITGGSR